jgi:uncharacterized membrane protein YuzA (DUF378 family)
MGFVLCVVLWGCLCGGVCSCGAWCGAMVCGLVCDYWLNLGCLIGSIWGCVCVCVGCVFYIILGGCGVYFYANYFTQDDNKRGIYRAKTTQKEGVRCQSTTNKKERKF